MTLIKSISGIRGTIGGKAGKGLTPTDIVKFSAAFGQWVIEKTENPKVVIGRDARVSGMIVSKLVTATLQSLGIDVLNLGLSTTPTVEMAVTDLAAGGGIILTASHNPGQWNALKLLNYKGEFISAEDGAEVLRIGESEEFEFAESNKLGRHDLVEDYLSKHIEKILALPLVDKESIKAANFRVIVDGINSSGGFAVPELLSALGVEQVEVINAVAHGRFAHNPEPLPEHLNDIMGRMENGNYHLGIVVDPDVDRLAFICDDGTPFGEEYTLVAIADYILKNNPGNTVSNLSSTRALRDVTESQGGQYHTSAVGEVNVVNKMKEVGAVIGGEGNGGVIYPGLHYGRDALVGIALFLSHLAKSEGSITKLRRSYPSYHISKNKIELTPELDIDYLLTEIERKYSGQPISTVDGVKIEFENEWVHLRKSNTEPIIRIYSESDSMATADHLANKIISDIREIISLKVE